MTRLSDFLFALPPLPPCPGRCPPMAGSRLLLGDTPGGLALGVAAWSGIARTVLARPDTRKKNSGGKKVASLRSFNFMQGSY